MPWSFTSVNPTRADVNLSLYLSERSFKLYISFARSLRDKRNLSSVILVTIHPRYDAGFDQLQKTYFSVLQSEDGILGRAPEHAHLERHADSLQATKTRIKAAKTSGYSLRDV